MKYALYFRRQSIPRCIPFIHGRLLTIKHMHSDKAGRHPRRPRHSSYSPRQHHVGRHLHFFALLYRSWNVQSFHCVYVMRDGLPEFSLSSCSTLNKSYSILNLNGNDIQHECKYPNIQYKYTTDTIVTM